MYFLELCIPNMFVYSISELICLQDPPHGTQPYRLTLLNHFSNTKPSRQVYLRVTGITVFLHLPDSHKGNSCYFSTRYTAVIFVSVETRLFPCANDFRNCGTKGGESRREKWRSEQGAER